MKSRKLIAAIATLVMLGGIGLTPNLSSAQTQSRVVAQDTECMGSVLGAVTKPVQVNGHVQFAGSFYCSGQNEVMAITLYVRHRTVVDGSAYAYDADSAAFYSQDAVYTGGQWQEQGSSFHTCQYPGQSWVYDGWMSAQMWDYTLSKFLTYGPYTSAPAIYTC